jgi:pilus assembly protein CpaE
MKIIAISSNEKQLFEIARILRERSLTDQVDVLSGLLDKAKLFEGGTPDVLLVAQSMLNEDDLERLETLGIQHPDMAMIVACQQQTPDFLLQAMRAGVREVLPLPVDAAQLGAALRRIEDKRQSTTRRWARCWPSFPARAAAAPLSWPPTLATRWPPPRARKSHCST